MSNQQEGGQQSGPFPIQDDPNQKFGEFNEENKRESNAADNLEGIRFYKNQKEISHKNIAFFKHKHDGKEGYDEECHQDKVVMKCCIIHPENVWKGQWDLFITLVLLFTCIVTPARMAFQEKDDPDAEVKISEMWTGWDIVQAITDVLFLFDIIIIFNTALVDENEIIVQDRKQIACDYIFGWFPLDIVAIIPFSFLVNLFNSGSGKVNNDLVRVARFGRLYKLVKLTKLLRVLKIVKEKSKIVKYIRQFLKIGLGFERLFIFLMSTLMFCHIITCLWVFVATNEQDDEEEGDKSPTWIDDYQDLSPSDKYLVSLYFVITSITTVGYGDISATNATERMFCIGLMLLGVIGFTFATGVLSSIISNYDNEDARYKQELAILERLHKQYHEGFPLELYNKLKKCIEYSDLEDDEELNEFINDLPHSLRVEVSNHIYSKVISKITLFSQKSSSFIAWICPLLKTIPVLENNLLYSEGDDIYSIYFSDKGSLGFTLQKYNNVKYVDLDQGMYFGVIDIVYSIYYHNVELDRWINSKDKMTRHFTCMAETESSLLALSICDLNKMKNEFQDTYEQIFSGAYEQLQKVMFLKLHANYRCQEQLKKFKGGLLANIGIAKTIQSEAKEFEVNCFSYKDLYDVRYEKLRKYILGLNEINKQSEKAILHEMDKFNQNQLNIDPEGLLQQAVLGKGQTIDGEDSFEEPEPAETNDGGQKTNRFNMQKNDQVRQEIYGVGRVNKPKKTPTQILNQTGQDSKDQIKPDDVTINMLEDQAEMNRLIDEKISKVEDRFMKQLKNVEANIQGQLSAILDQLKNGKK